MTVESDDLDAVEDIEAAISNFLGESTELQLPTFFVLKYRKAQEVQRLLESILGLSDGGTSAGGGEGGGLLAGMASNMLPGGNLLDGLLDGGEGGGTGSELEGDVGIGTDVRSNTLWVTGATANDLSLINSLIEYWDRAEGEIKLELFGETRMIKVYHRDAVSYTHLTLPTILLV